MKHSLEKETTIFEKEMNQSQIRFANRCKKVPNLKSQDFLEHLLAVLSSNLQHNFFFILGTYQCPKDAKKEMIKMFVDGIKSVMLEELEKGVI